MNERANSLPADPALDGPDRQMGWEQRNRQKNMCQKKTSFKLPKMKVGRYKTALHKSRVRRKHVRKALGNEWDYLCQGNQRIRRQAIQNLAPDFLDRIHSTKKQYDTKEKVTEKYLHFKVKKQGWMLFYNGWIAFLPLDNNCERFRRRNSHLTASQQHSISHLRRQYNCIMEILSISVLLLWKEHFLGSVRAWGI